MRIHFIAIGGAVMHNLAIALHKKGHRITGSDDLIFDPARTNLTMHDLLPENTGWDSQRISNELDAIILGMHARPDNPELLKALDLGIRIYSFPEYMYEQTKEKVRVVIGGSHGKTTITSMVMHVLKSNGIKFDYLVGSSIPGFETMVGLSDDSELAVFEGDEYLSSPLDATPKFHHYKPRIGLISGIAWDHMNVFPTYEEYVEQFRIFSSVIEPGGTLIYYQKDPEAEAIARARGNQTRTLGYVEHMFHKKGKFTYLDTGDKPLKVSVFGRHNMQNIKATQLICRELGIRDENFYNAIGSYTGAARRLETIREEENFRFFYDFAHAPSKLKATTEAVKDEYPEKELVACIELHTYSSLNQKFLNQYRDTFNAADRAVVFFSPDTLVQKRLPPISGDQLKKAFNREDLIILNNPTDLEGYLAGQSWKGRILLMMSSGNFSGLNIKGLANKLKLK